jgi:hypothetical protein
MGQEWEWCGDVVVAGYFFSARAFRGDDNSFLKGSQWGLTVSVLHFRIQGQARQGCHLVIVEVSIDGKAVSPDSLSLARGAGLGSPLYHTAGITLGPHQLWDLLVLLQGPCREKWMREWWVGEW